MAMGKGTYGQVYILRAGKTRFFKIGLTYGNLFSRIKDLQIGCPYILKLYNTIESSNVRWLEKAIHVLFENYRRHGEWFELSAAKLNEFISSTLPDMLDAQSDQAELKKFIISGGDTRCESCKSYCIYMLTHDTIKCRVCGLQRRTVSYF